MNPAIAMLLAAGFATNEPSRGVFTGFGPKRGRDPGTGKCACGKTISGNKKSCFACLQKAAAGVSSTSGNDQGKPTSQSSGRVANKGKGE